MSFELQRISRENNKNQGDIIDNDDDDEDEKCLWLKEQKKRINPIW